MPKFNYRAGRAIATAAFLPLVLFAVSTAADEYMTQTSQAAPMSVTPAYPAPQQTQAAAPAAKTARSSVDRVEAHIANLHKKLGVTPDQEALWNDMAQVMRKNAQSMRDEFADRNAKLKQKNVTAVDDLRSYQMITDERADGLKRLIPVFEALYVKMTPAQQKNADQIFSMQQKRAARRS